MNNNNKFSGKKERLAGKRFLAVAVTLMMVATAIAMICCAPPSSEAATTNADPITKTVEVNDHFITSDLPSSITYTEMTDDTPATLTLTNASFVYSDGSRAIQYNGSNTIVIKLVGNNTISYSATSAIEGVIYIPNGNLKIIGNDKNTDTLTITTTAGAATNKNFYGIYAQGDKAGCGNVTIKNCGIDITFDGGTATSGNPFLADGIRVVNSVSVESSNLTFTMGDITTPHDTNALAGIRFSSELNVKDSEITAIIGDANGSLDDYDYASAFFAPFADACSFTNTILHITINDPKGYCVWAGLESVPVSVFGTIYDNGYIRGSVAATSAELVNITTDTIPDEWHRLEVNPGTPFADEAKAATVAIVAAVGVSAGAIIVVLVGRFF